MKRYISAASLPCQAATPTRKPSKMPRTLLALYLETRRTSATKGANPLLDPFSAFVERSDHAIFERPAASPEYHQNAHLAVT
jgi:hypothetical protein